MSARRVPTVVVVIAVAVAAIAASVVGVWLLRPYLEERVEVCVIHAGAPNYGKLVVVYEGDMSKKAGDGKRLYGPVGDPACREVTGYNPAPTSSATPR